MNKIKIAFIKFSGCASGGTEKYLQTIAANLPKDKFDVTYFYCDAAPYIGSDWKHPDTNLSRIEYLKRNGINLIKFNVEAKDVTKPHHPWVNTNFWEVFDESKYDIIQTGRAGHPEYPFTEIHKTPIVDSLHLMGMAERKENIHTVILLCEEQKQKWIQAGGDSHKAIIIPSIQELPLKTDKNFRAELNIKESDIVCGFHQRNDPNIFSSVPLMAYKETKNEFTKFIILGGSELHRQQARELNLEVIFLDFNGDINYVNKFISTLNIYVHGRKDGEVCSTAITEAMHYGLPIVSHIAQNNGTIEQIQNGGLVATNINEYVEELSNLINNKEHYIKRSKASLDRYNTYLSLETNINKIVAIYEKIMHEKELDKMTNEEFWSTLE